MDNKRTDVGYKRPPVETQFKKGQKPPPRKKKSSTSTSMRDILWKVLQEPRRAGREGKAVWITNTELIVRRAFMEAEKGAPVLHRLLSELILETQPDEKESWPTVITLPDSECGGFHFGTISMEEAPPED